MMQVETAFLLLEAAGLGAHLGHRDAGRVVDEEARLHEAFHGVGELLHVFLAEEAGAQLVRVDLGVRGEHAHEQRFLRHFQREDADHFAVEDGGVLGDVHGQRGFAHRGARGDDDEIAGLEAAGHLVEHACSGWRVR